MSLRVAAFITTHHRRAGFVRARVQIAVIAGAWDGTRSLLANRPRGGIATP